jgi:CubicO group peptidase (beta-lactamase class C family)
MRILLLFRALALILAGAASLRADPAPTLESQLETIRSKYHLPALAGAIFTTDGVTELAAVGVRKMGATIPVTTNDLWHLGSDTKAMTATLAGTFVAEKKLSWEDEVISFFPELAAQVPATMRTITLAQVLEHQAGLPVNLDWPGLSRSGSVSEQRLASVKMALTAPAFLPSTFHYSNTDYVVIGAILEKIGGMPWEDLMRERLFKPLAMNSAGFGGVGTIEQIDQPWPHLDGGMPMPSNGPLMDNPPVMGPAGVVHCSMTDWSKFLVDQLRGGIGMKALLPPDIYRAMQPDPPASGDGYGYGWGVTKRDWAGGKALNHAGSNTMNYCDCWLAPAKKFGVLVCTNQGGGAAAKAADEACYVLIQRYLASAPPSSAP